MEGDKYCLYSKDGKKKLGTFPTRKGAEEQERAIKVSLATGKKDKNKKSKVSYE
jgi:hypothetical protein